MHTSPGNVSGKRRIVIGSVLILVGLLTGVLAQQQAIVSAKKRLEALQGFFRLAESTGAYASSITELSHDVSKTLESNYCGQNCPPEAIKSWATLASTLDDTAASFAVDVSEKSFSYDQPHGYMVHDVISHGVLLKNAEVSQFLNKTRPMVLAIASQANTRETLTIKQKADKLALENENLRLQNEKLRKEIEGTPGPVMRFLQSGGGAVTWAVATSIGINQLYLGLRRVRRRTRRPSDHE